MQRLWNYEIYYHCNIVSHGGNKEQIMSKRGEALKNAFPLI